MEHIKTLVEEENNIIFVSSHESVREALAEAGFKFYIARPDIPLLDVYLENYKARGNDQSFIDLIESNWTRWLFDIDKFANQHLDQVTLLILRRNVYLQKAVEYLVDKNFPTAPYRFLIGEHRIIGLDGEE